MRVLIMVLLLSAAASAAPADGGLTLQEAEGIFLERNAEVRLKRMEIQKAEADLAEAGAFPNPVLKYSHESLKNGERETEQTLAVSQSLDLTGKRSKKIDGASKSLEGRLCAVEYEIRGLAARMKQTYCRVLLLGSQVNALKTLLEFHDAVEMNMKLRLEVGDISEADVMKLSLERGKVARELMAAEADHVIERKKLALLLDLPVDAVTPVDSLEQVPAPDEPRTIAGNALASRADLKAQELSVQAAGVNLALARREAIPSIDIEAGYKRRTGGFDGFVAGISIPLPIFNRNQGGIARAKASFEQERAAFELMKRQAGVEIDTLLVRAEQLKSGVSGLRRDAERARELTATARIAYEEGETGILELLEATRSEREMTLNYRMALLEYRSTLFELERASGVVKTTGGR